MNEIIDIVEDIKSGALPVEELPDFILWLIGKFFWPLFAIICLASAYLLFR